MASLDEEVAMVGLLFALVVVVLAMVALERSLHFFVRGETPAWLSTLLARRAPRTPEPMPSVLRELELSRMAALLSQAERAEAQGRMTRVTACTLAYDDALCACAAAYGLATPSVRPLTPSQRVHSEVELLAAGASW